MNLLVVGHKPSSKNTDPEVPFFGTSSGKTLQKWLVEIKKGYGQRAAIVYMNVLGEVDAKIPTKEDLLVLAKEAWLADKIICLGDIASKYIAILTDKETFKLPHPSGRNRKLNDKRWVQEQLDLCVEYLKS